MEVGIREGAMVGEAVMDMIMGIMGVDMVVGLIMILMVVQVITERSLAFLDEKKFSWYSNNVNHRLLIVFESLKKLLSLSHHLHIGLKASEVLDFPTATLVITGASPLVALFSSCCA